MSFAAIMRTASEEQLKQGVPSPSLPSSKASSSSSSSFCSFDVSIWEDLHLQSLSSASSSSVVEDHQQAAAGGGQLWKAERIREPKSHLYTQGFSSFFSSSARASFSGVSSPHRLSNASSTSGYALSHLSNRRDNSILPPSINSPLHYKADQLPVVKVIQKGSMSFTSDELVLQQAPNKNEEPYSIENPHSTQTSTTTLPEEESHPTEPPPSSTPEAPRSDEKSIVLGSFPSVKFLQTSAPDVYSSPISPLKSKGSIPFKWEEMPGRPKLDANLAQPKSIIPSLQLPPKLLHSSSYSQLSNCNSPYSNSHSKHTASTSPFSADGFTSKPTSIKSLWHSFVQSGRRSYREGGRRSRFNMLVGDEDPCSPTSTLIGPDAGLSSSSSTSSTLDALCASPGRVPEVQSAPSRGWAFNMDDKALCSQSGALVPISSSSSSSLCEAPSYVGNDLPNLAPSMERKVELPLSRKATDRLRGFLKACQRWRSSGSHRKRNIEEAEMWAPTLATYFHSMELERNSSVSGKSLLLHQRSLEKHRNEWNSDSPIQNSTCVESMDAHASMDGLKGLMSSDLLREDVMVFSAKPTVKFPLALKGKNVKLRRKGGGWVLRKLKKSSRVLAAMLRAVAKGTTNTSSNMKCKRRRLPYQRINW